MLTNHGMTDKMFPPPIPDNHWVEIEVYASRTNVYLGDYFEWSVNDSAMRKYYAAGGVRVAQRQGSTAITVNGGIINKVALTHSCLESRLISSIIWGKLGFVKLFQVMGSDYV